MNAHPFRTTARIRNLLLAGAVIHTREDALEALTRSITENNQAVMARLQALETRNTELQRDLDSRPVTPAHARRMQIGEGAGGEEQSRSMPLHDSQRVANFEDSVIRAEREAIGLFIREGGGSYNDELLEVHRAGSGMSVGSDPDGGYLVTPVLSTSIQQRQADVSPIGRLARRVTLTTGDSFEEPVDASEIGAEWVDETEARPELDTAELRMLKVPLNEIYTLQPVTQRLIDDSSYNIGAYIESKISDKFAQKGGNAFVNGDGIGKPEGFLHRGSTAQPDGVRDYFTLQHVNTGVGDGWPVDAPADKLIELVYTLRAPYRKNARWLMNLKTAGVVRKLKDSEGRYVWQDGISAGQPPLLLGYPVEMDEEMPDIGEGLTPIAFGDFQAGYIIVDRPGVRILVDPYTKKPYVLFYAYTRMGGQVQNGEAIKLLRFAVSG